MTKRKLMTLLREAEGWSMRDLAKKIGTSVSTVSRIERGDQKPTLTYLEKFSKVMHMPVPLLIVNKKRDGKFIFRTLEKILASILKTRKKYGKLGRGHN